MEEEHLGELELIMLLTQITLDITILLLIINGFVLHFFNIKVNLKFASIIFTFIASIILYLYSNYNLQTFSSDYSIYCKTFRFLNSETSLWTQREFLFWGILGRLYRNIFINGNCTNAITFYMLPTFYILFFYL